MNEFEPKKSDLPKETLNGRKVCAWCKKDSGPSNTEGDSHGICEECLAKVSEEEGIETEK